MNTWLKLLPIEIKEVTNYLLPPSSVDTSKDTVIGSLPDELIKLYSLWTATSKECDRTLVDLRYSRADEALFARYDELSDKAKALELLFWIGVKEHFNLWGVGVNATIGIRQEYQIVKFSREDNIPPFLKGLFGFPR